MCAMIDFGAILLVCLLICPIPGIIAQCRRHRNTTAIWVCGVIGGFVWPFWLVALIWSLTANVEPDVQPAAPVKPIGPVDPAQQEAAKASLTPGDTTFWM
jgi:hypothetical protein